MAFRWNSERNNSAGEGTGIGAAASRSKARSAGKCSGNRHPDFRETTTASYLSDIRDINVCARAVRRRAEDRPGGASASQVSKRFKFVVRLTLNYRNVCPHPIASTGSSVYLR